MFHRALLAGLLLSLATSGCDDESTTVTDGPVITPDSLVKDGVSAQDAAADAAGDLSGAEDLTPDAGADAAPACIQTLIPSPCQAGFDLALEQLATTYERSFHAVSAATMDVGTEVTVADATDRALVQQFLQQGSGWDFSAGTGKAVTAAVDQWHKIAGLYGGVGIAADAFRYGVLRDEGYPKPEVDRARVHLLAALDALHLAKAITGTAPSIARGFIRTDIPKGAYSTTPLFDSGGNPLPPEKNNGTWRDDNSGGLYPNHIWEDSCSRDMLIGWVAAMGAVWEVIENDSTIPQGQKQQLQADAKQLGLGLSVVQKSGFDLELVDADGRTTYHGYLNENNLDRIYVPNPWIKNGVHAIMALGIVATLVHVSGDAALKAYLDQQLIAKRKLHEIAKNQLIVDAGPKSNYSGYNMAFMGAWLAARHLKDAQALADVRAALKDKLYNNPLGATKPQPVGWKQSLFDLIYAAGMAEASAHGPTTGAVDAQALANALDTLGQFPQPPFWAEPVENCDAQELQNKLCTAVDGKTTIVLNPINDRGDNPQSLTPMPFVLRPPSNYDWRSNPFRVNGGGGGNLMLSGVDFRFAYWLGRWVRR
jgi:hypothetical protein